MSQPRRKLTVADYQHFPEDGQRHELADGEEVVTPAPTAQHQRILGEIFVAVREVARARGLGEVFFAALDVVLSEHDVLQPDLLFISAARAGILTTRAEGPPDLAVEVLARSSRRTDELRKRRRYELFGVAEPLTPPA